MAWFLQYNSYWRFLQYFFIFQFQIQGVLSRAWGLLFCVSDINNNISGIHLNDLWPSLVSHTSFVVLEVWPGIFFWSKILQDTTFFYFVEFLYVCVFFLSSYLWLFCWRIGCSRFRVLPVPWWPNVFVF